MASPPRLLPRRRLLDRLRRGIDHGVALVQGDPGSGKSTLLRLLARESDLRLVSVALDDRAQDAAFLIGAIGEALEVPGVVTTDARNAADKLPRLLVGLRDVAPLVLALDDVHHVGPSPSALRMLGRLAAERPPGVGLILVSRGPIRIALSTPRLREELTEIGNADLRVSPDEVAALVSWLAPGVALSEATQQRLYESTRGWLAAVVLLASDLRTREPEHVLEGLAALGSTLDDYLAEHVLDGLAAAQVDQLECAAAIEPFDAELLEEVAGAPAGPALARAEAQHLVVRAPCGTYAFSGLIGDLVRERLRRRPGRWDDVHRRAGAVHLARGNLERALHHVLEAGDTGAAVDLLATVGYAALTTNRVRAVARYLDRLPAETVDASVPLRFCRATVRMMRFDATAGLADWKAVAAADDFPPLAAAARARLAYFATWQGRFEEVVRLARWALAPAPPLPDGIAVYAHAFLEVALRHLGRDDEADRITSALDAADLTFPASGIPPFGRGLILQLHGDWARERALAREWIDRIERAGSTIGLASFHVLAAWAEAKLGRHEAALECVARGLEVCEAGEQEWWACNLRLIRLEALAALGRRDAVRAEGLDLLAVCRAHGMTWNEVGAQLALAPFADDPDLTLGAAWEAARRTEHPALRSQVRLEQARRALAAGDASGARHLLGEAMAELGNVQAAEQRHGIALLQARLDLQEGDRVTARACLQRHLVPGPALRTERAHLVPLLLDLVEARDARLAETARAQILEAGVGALPALLAAGTERSAALSDAVLDDAAGPLDVVSLGAFRVVRGSRSGGAPEVVHFRSAQVAELLRLLLVLARTAPVPREVLMEALWPDEAATAAHNLHTHLSYLRRALEPHAPPRAASRYVLRDGDGYRLDLRGGTWDAASFETEADAGLRAIAEGTPDAGERFLETALSRYGGPLFPDRPYLAPAAPLRARLERLMVDASLACAVHARSCGRFRAAEEHLHRLLLQDASVEEAYRLLMELAADQDQADRVPAILDRCRRELREQLDVAPSAKTEDTARRLMAGR